MNTLEQMDRLIAWLEAMELEAHKEAAKHEGKAEAFRSAALKARFARQGMQSPNAEAERPAGRKLCDSQQPERTDNANR